MIKENIAERLFCDLRNLEIKIEKPEYIVEGAKIGYVSVINGVVSQPAKQFTIFGCKREDDYWYCFGHGPAFQVPNTNETFTNAYNEFLEAVKSQGKVLKFYSLVIPRKGVVDVKLEEFETVLSRYIKDYYVGTDEMLWRWDVLVSGL